MESLFENFPTKPNAQECNNSYLILCNSHYTASSFLEIYNTEHIKIDENTPPTSIEQDLLRAMLVFACSGLDSLIKQLSRDALSTIIEIDEGANDYFKTYVERRFRKDETIDNKLFAEVITDHNPRQKLIELLIQDILNQSLQSTDQILRVGSYFNIPSDHLTQNVRNLSRIFNTRNQIVHEMDVNFKQVNGNRRIREKSEMIVYTNEVFKLAYSFINSIDLKICA